MLARKALAGTAGAPKVYVEDVFSTYLYTGTGATNTISNSIDLSGEGGLVWIKNRSNAGYKHMLYDTARGATKSITTNETEAENTDSVSLTAFTSTGFTLGADSANGYVNNSTTSHVSWTFRKAKKFFDVVTYTGNGTSGRTVAHNLGSTPGCIIVKKTSNTDDWQVYHRSLGNTKFLVLNTTAAESTGSDRWNSTTPTSTEFTVGNAPETNQNGATYVAYLFAHDAGGFGDAGSDSIIKCGSFTATSGTFTDLGWEPQWLLVKNITAENSWSIVDSMRGVATNQNDSYLIANTTAAEVSTSDIFDFNAKGFTVKFTSATDTYIYIAIRRGPMKTPTTGTSVFSTGLGSSSATATYTSGFVTDAALALSRPDDGSGYGRNIYSRLQGNFRSIATNTTNSEATATDNTTISFTQNDGIKTNGGGVYNADWVYEQFRRAPGFFDVVCYTGTGSTQTTYHNLGVVPELIIFKNRTGTPNRNWGVYAASVGTEKKLWLNATNAVQNDSFFVSSTPTATVLNEGIADETNESGKTYVAYLFASLSGVSKVGSYTGNGSSVTVTTDFQPRFILVKRTDSTGDWIFSDSARGLVAGNDPYLELNTADAEVTNEDWVDISSTSFTVNQTTNNANVNTGTYIYLAIA